MLVFALSDRREVRSPEPSDRALLASVHDAGYLEFLATVWDRWSADGESGEAAMAGVGLQKEGAERGAQNEGGIVSS